MKSFNLLLGMFFLTSFCLAQNQRVINVNTGQKFQVKSDAKILSNTEAMGQKMEISVSAIATSQVSVDGSTPIDYDLTGTMKTIKMNLSMMGQEMVFDSENPDASNPMTAQIDKILNQPQTIKIDRQGKVISVSTDDDFNQLLKQFGSSGDIAKQAFLAIPPNLKAGDSFSTNETDEMSGSKTSMIYTVKSIAGDLVTLAFKGTVDTDMTTETQGMEVHVVTNGTTEGEAVVNVKTGVVKSIRNKLKSKGKSEVMGQELPTEVEAETLTTVSEV